MQKNPCIFSLKYEHSQRAQCWLLERGDPPQFASLASPACQTSVQIQLQVTDSVSNCVVSASPFADVFHIVEISQPK